VDTKTTRILLIGKDPIFAWALEQKIGALGYRVEHVYTLAEAKLRMNRFEYAAVLMDGLGKEDVELLCQNGDPKSAVFVFDDTQLEAAPRISTTQKSRPIIIPKESALSCIISSLKELN
jgi:hypothetical protein